MPPVTFRLTIEYDGSAFHGWQRQKEVRTVQAEIERAIGTMTGQPVTLNGSGRTDAGVHALAQVASFRCATRIGQSAFLRGLNSLLPPDVVILECRQVADPFHARYDAISKVYHFRIRKRPLPSAVGRQYAWCIHRPLNLDAMMTASATFTGRHDFGAFEGSGSPRAHRVRTVLQSRLFLEGAEYLVYEIEADGFLRYMVRNIVGTLVQVGVGKLSPSDCGRILADCDRRQAGPTAPPQGLFLMRVRYDRTPERPDA